MKGANFMNQEQIGRFIAELRNEKNMTRPELADKIGVTDRAISKWKNGKVCQVYHYYHYLLMS